MNALKRTTLLLALLAGAALAVPASALEGTLKKVKESGAITIGHRDASIPFSYYDDKQRPVGYSVELCKRIVNALRKDLKMPKIDINYQLVTSANRIPLMANGTIDLECGSTTNNLERQKQVSYTYTSFVTATRYVYKKSAKLNSLNALKGKTVVSTAGTTNLKLITRLNNEQNLGMNIVAANGHSEAFLMVETGRAAAFAMDDILLYGLVANSKKPSMWAVSSKALSVEPYGIMLRKDDPEFKKAVDAAMARIFKSGEIYKIYKKWFQSKIPPKGINLNLPMSAQLKKVIAHPTDSGDPADYE
jgi:glutamate/aspartate transport system substrate-binding protein